MPTTLDGFVAGLNGEMDLINAEDEMLPLQEIDCPEAEKHRSQVWK